MFTLRAAKNNCDCKHIRKPLPHQRTASEGKPVEHKEVSGGRYTIKTSEIKQT